MVALEAEKSLGRQQHRAITHDSRLTTHDFFQSYSIRRAVHVAAVSSPWRRATMWRLMSIPAEIPAEVTIAALRRRSATSSSIVTAGYWLAHPGDAGPVGRGRFLPSRMPALGEEERAGADAGRQFGLVVLRGDPIEEARPLSRSRRVPMAAGYDQDIEVGVGVAAVDRQVRLDQQPAGSADSAALLRDRPHAEQAILVGILARSSRDREDLDRPSRSRALPPRRRSGSLPVAVGPRPSLPSFHTR